MQCIQEPSERTLSAWNMVNRTMCAKAKPEDGCRVPSLQETVDADLNPHGRPECIFGTSVRQPQLRNSTRLCSCMPHPLSEGCGHRRSGGLLHLLMSSIDQH